MPSGLPQPLHVTSASCPGRAPLDLSIIVPAYDEEDNVRPLYERVMASVPALGLDFELVFVDDGSKDRTFERLAELAAEDPRVRVIKLRRNHGQTAAMVAGIDEARGRVLVTMDADLQNDPEDIARLLAKLEEGYELVVGWRRNRQEQWLTRRLPSHVANRLIAWVTGVDVKDNGCTLKAFRATLIKSLPLYAELHRFIPAMCSIAGARFAELEVLDHPRRAGASKYGLSRIYRVCFDLVTVKTLLVFGRNPLVCFATSAALAAACSALAFVAALYVLMQTDGPVVTFTGISILFGWLAIFLASAGMIGALVHQHFSSGGGAGFSRPPPWVATFDTSGTAR